MIQSAPMSDQQRNQPNRSDDDLDRTQVNRPTDLPQPQPGPPSHLDVRPSTPHLLDVTRPASRPPISEPPPVPEPPPFKTPPQPRKRRRAGFVWLAVRLVAALTALMVAGVVTLVALYNIFPPPRTNLLILGLDSRPGQGDVTRTDTIILATVDPAGPYVGALSIPRDLYVPIPGYSSDRINVAHVLGEQESPGGGPELAARTIEQNFGVPVHRTLRMDFEAFVAIVDAAGGVTIDVESPFIDYEYPTPDYGTMVVSFEAGVQHMDGERALQYARIRHGASDFERAARQGQVIEALARRLINPLNWWRLPAVYMAFIQHVVTDLTVIDVALMAPAVIEVGPGNIDRRVLDRGMVWGRQTSAGASVLEPNWDTIRPMLDEMFD
jgi:LCP family protein required for cell wall assembly